MNNSICYIVGAGENYGIDFTLRQGDYVIAADGGYRYLEQAGIPADLIIGDFDTLEAKPEHPNVITLPTEKDDTDTLAAVREGMKLGYKRFCLYACTGGRIEHTLANFQVLAFLAQSGFQGFLFDRESIITAIHDGELAFSAHEEGCVSVFYHSSQAGEVTLKGVKYELDSYPMTNTFPIGVSNEFVGTPSTIAVQSGTLLVVFPRAYKEDLNL